MESERFPTIDWLFFNPGVDGRPLYLPQRSDGAGGLQPARGY